MHREREWKPGWIEYKISDEEALAGIQRFLDERKHRNDDRNWVGRLLEILDHPDLLTRKP